MVSDTFQIGSRDKDSDLLTAFRSQQQMALNGKVSTMADLREITNRTSVQHVEYHPTLDSTNRLAIDLLADLLPLTPALVLTDEQTSGRGRGSNQWWASAGALTFSLVMNAAEANLPPQRRPLVSLAVGLAVRNVLAERLTGRSVAIKWPNDVLVNERKVCGILVEQHSIDDNDALIIGVGINVNNSLANAPTDVQQRATSLFDMTGQSCSTDQLLIDVLNEFDEQCSQLIADPAALIQAINDYSFLNGRSIVLQTATTQHSGRCQGIDSGGALQLLTQTGVQAFLSGSIDHWK